ncbi:histone-lysine N-methyltransferase SUVR2-like protein [Medicago truncatula]|uniref:Histone-lysine N-methyltransferase SUVR2-like protein n=1 Tax=Medicago truncatula TaxID=3880 RepID=A0A072VWL4_MEDTR|nr:histone-lysine N-methyltransferase SUVR2-like protein [Medicago truncatula]
MAPRPNPKIAAALQAMTAFGIPEAKVKRVLKKLLKLFDKNWQLIEEENYRALLDAIFEEGDDFEEPEPQKKNKRVNEEETEAEEAPLNVESARPLKRLRLRGQENSSPSSASSPLKKSNIEKATALEGGSSQQPRNNVVSSDGNGRVAARPMRDASFDRGKQPASPHASYEFTVPKSEPVDEEDYERRPLAMVPPEPSSLRRYSRKNGVTEKQGAHVSMTPSHHNTHKEVVSDVVIASSAQGEVKLSLSCSSALQGPDFRMPTQEQLLKMIEDKCLRSYKIIDPNFSVAKMLRDVCDCMLEFSTDSNDNSQEGSMPKSSIDVSKESEVDGTPAIGGSKDLDTGSHSSNGSIQVNSFSALVSPRGPFSPAHQSSLDDAVLVSEMNRTNDIPQSDVRMQPEDPVSPNSLSLVVVPHHQSTEDRIRSYHDVSDLTKGEENNQISWVNESSTNDFPPPFNYIPQNLVFRDAYVNISLSRIGAEDSCSCIGSCVLLSDTHCACTCKTGGEFAYTAQGLIKEEFLEQCIAISHNPQQHCFYCKDCPLERSKSDGCLEPCKGHLKRKFIKECWSKCGCGKQCGNRVIQRGITYNLQVFFTSEGKGWGLRTLEELPKGAFVCEFAGEILTIKELHERNIKCAENGKSTYPVLLDADWDSTFVKDEEALCLDAASFGNIARFINHRY